MNSPLPSSTSSGLTDCVPSVDALYRELSTALRAGGMPTPELDARILVCHALDITHEELAAHPDAPTSGSARALALTYAQRRCAREPVSRIVGAREFWGLDFDLTRETLDPRADTETLVNAALEALSETSVVDRPCILDIGTGSGCILVSLLHELLAATGVGTDLSEGALCVARNNAARHGVASRTRFVCTSWAAGVSGRFDLIVSNPPYISTNAIGTLEPEVREHEPRAALDGGADGLDAYRAIIPALGQSLAPGGWVIFEVGADQSGAVGDMLANEAHAPVFEMTRSWHDLAGHVRCIGARRSPSL